MAPTKRRGRAHVKSAAFILATSRRRALRFEVYIGLRHESIFGCLKYLCSRITANVNCQCQRVLNRSRSSGCSAYVDPTKQRDQVAQAWWPSNIQFNKWCSYWKSYSPFLCFEKICCSHGLGKHTTLIRPAQLPSVYIDIHEHSHSQGPTRVCVDRHSLVGLL